MNCCLLKNAGCLIEEAEIKYFIPENAGNAVLYVFSLNGNMLLSKPLTQTGNGSITISGSELEAGMYIYTLAVNGIEADSKRMIITDK
ncbi:MAG: T9SS type A sorting domain-containing protein [Salinivirgaceae bacterium]|nr:T9SS type A sorting domain-containing protein [Salinivirgaceae bacterium]